MLDYQPPNNLLTGKTILVTGAGDGIGKAISMAFAEHGATVILLGRTLAKLEAVYDQIEESGGAQPAIYPMNLEGATNKDYYDLAQTLESEFGTLEGVVHNAAQLRLLSRIDDYDIETWFQVMQVNINAPFMLTQALLPLLRKAEQASLLFTSDQVGRKAKAYWGAYGVSKFAVEGLMQTLAQELESSNIRVNSINPGPTLSALRKLAFPGEESRQLKLPETLAPIYLWLMGSESIDIHGQAIDAETYQPPG
ncbi:MAG: YciK family oxidoreductase [Gammaproteobacteria bacterium]|nr:YciK family oxidoreductase [Gammaproteobacteria bacterium]